MSQPLCQSRVFSKKIFHQVGVLHPTTCKACNHIPETTNKWYLFISLNHPKHHHFRSAPTTPLFYRERIDDFIDDNKSMIRRMFGNVESPSDPSIKHFQTFDGKQIRHRGKRAANVGGSPHKVDACESTVEIVTPYWASNSHGKIRAIVNTQHLQQAIQQVSKWKYSQPYM